MDPSAAETSDSLLRAVAKAPHVAPSPVEGEVIGGNFRIERRLGAGGMGVVYLAHDLRLHRPVALKLHSAGDGALRTEREARILARLVHPNVVTVYDVGTWRGRTYIAMEYLDGGTLRAWLGARQHRWREILSIFIKAARGLEAAHHAGLVHRDFKPDNVLLGSGGRVRVADFGLARPVRGAPPADVAEPPARAAEHAPALSIDAPLTVTGACVGTPGYMAPEAERGGEVDARADQYSFCVALSSALVGRRAPRWINPILERGLLDDPERRHPSLSALLDALERHLRPRRPRWAWQSIAVVTALVLGGGLVAAERSRWQAVRLPPCPEPALPDLYVATFARSDGNGSAACPFRTITEALAASAATRILHVAAGSYDEKHGERFPLVIRGATAIRGAGRDATVVAGMGVYEPALERASLRLGDATAEVSVSELTIKAVPGDTLDRSYGIVCDRGNLVDFTSAPKPGNTRLDGVTIGPGFETAVATSNGCNLAVKRGYFHGSHRGIWLKGGPDSLPLGLDVEGSVFTGLSPGAGLRIWHGTRDLRVVRNTFVNSAYGIFMSSMMDQSVVIEDNDFWGLSKVAIQFERSVHVERFERNMIHDNPGAVAVHIRGFGDDAPRIRARNNIFASSRGYVEIVGEENLIPRRAVIDFGRPEAPGRNRFLCSLDQDGHAAAEVIIRGTAAAAARLHFFGNTWDHAPPTRGHGPAATADVSIAGGPAPAIDLGGAMRGTECAPR